MIIITHYCSLIYFIRVVLQMVSYKYYYPSVSDTMLLFILSLQSIQCELSSLDYVLDNLMLLTLSCAYYALYNYPGNAF